MNERHIMTPSEKEVMPNDTGPDQPVPTANDTPPREPVSESRFAGHSIGPWSLSSDRRCGVASLLNGRGISIATVLFPDQDGELLAASPSLASENASLRDLVTSETKRLNAIVDRLTRERDAMREAINLVMFGGNHLASVLVQNVRADFATDWVPLGTDHETALRRLGATDEYEIWCCWDAIMRARATLAQLDGGKG